MHSRRRHCHIMLMAVMAGLVSFFCTGRFSHAEPAEVKQRIALIIVNDAYDNYPYPSHLLTPRRDAEEIEKLLRQFDFDVFAVVVNADSTTLAKRLEEFRERGLGVGDRRVGLLYYSGHGVGVSQHENYILTTDATSDSDNAHRLSAEDIVKTYITSAGVQAIAILDMCRTGLGVAEVQASHDDDLPHGKVLIAHASGPNRAAHTGLNETSQYTTYLINEIRARPDAQLTDILKTVGEKNELFPQKPEYYGDIDFVFAQQSPHHEKSSFLINIGIGYAYPWGKIDNRYPKDELRLVGDEAAVFRQTITLSAELLAKIKGAYGLGAYASLGFLNIANSDVRLVSPTMVSWGLLARYSHIFDNNIGLYLGGAFGWEWASVPDPAEFEHLWLRGLNITPVTLGTSYTYATARHARFDVGLRGSWSVAWFNTASFSATDNGQLAPPPFSTPYHYWLTIGLVGGIDFVP
jgi:Caspase domain